jgi:hypothetical protein
MSLGGSISSLRDRLGHTSRGYGALDFLKDALLGKALWYTGSVTPAWRGFIGCVHSAVDRRTGICPVSGLKSPAFDYRLPGPRAIPFVSIASTAESFRSTCGAERRPPECNIQRLPAAAPHVGQGTDNNCFAVRSLIFI